MSEPEYTWARVMGYCTSQTDAETIAKALSIGGTLGAVWPFKQTRTVRGNRFEREIWLPLHVAGPWFYGYRWRNCEEGSKSEPANLLVVVHFGEWRIENQRFDGWRRGEQVCFRSPPRKDYPVRRR